MADEITVPRPDPDEYVIAVCTEDGAVAWVKGSKGSIPGLLAQLLPVMEENEQTGHDPVATEAARIRQAMNEVMAHPGRAVTVQDGRLA